MHHIPDEKSPHDDPVRLDIPLDIYEYTSSDSLSSGNSTTNMSNDDDDLNSSMFRFGDHAPRLFAFTFRHCRPPTTVGLQPVIIQLALLQTPENILKIVEHLGRIGDINVIPATAGTCKEPQYNSLLKIFENPWDPTASADEAFGRREEQDWRRNFGAIHPTLVEEPVEDDHEDTLVQEDSEEDEPVPSSTPDDERSYTLANFRPTDEIRLNSTGIPMVFFSDPRSSEMVDVWRTDNQNTHDSESAKSFLCGVKEHRSAFMLPLVVLVLVCVFLSRLLETSITNEIEQPIVEFGQRYYWSGFTETLWTCLCTIFGHSFLVWIT